MDTATLRGFVDKRETSVFLRLKGSPSNNITRGYVHKKQSLVAPYNRSLGIPKNVWVRTPENQFRKDTNNGLNNSLVVAPEDQPRKGPNYGPKNSAPVKHENPLKKSQPKSSLVLKSDDGQRRRSVVSTRGGVGSDDRNNKKRGAFESEEEGTGSTGDVSENAGTQKNQNKVCRYWVYGNCVKASKCRFLHCWSTGDSLSMLAKLEGHEKAVTGIALPVGTDKLYSGSLDGKVRVWDCHTGHCAHVIDQYDKIGCLINEGRWVFVGMPNVVKALNIENSTEFSLEHPFGQVNAMVVANDMLFAGTQDGVILAWKGGSEANPFQLAASMNGHTGAVICLTVGCKFLYSGSMDHTITMWDLDTLDSIMTLHGHSDAVMSLLCWDKYLLSCSLDQTIKVWGATEEGNLEVTFTQKEEHGLLALSGMNDEESKSILFCSCNDNSVRLYELPSFTERGRLFSKQEVREIQMGPPGGLFFTGDGTGMLTVWKWSAKASQGSS